MESKNLIVMIIVVLVFFCGQLAAEEVVGVSIFPNIETPHPYPKAAVDNTLVWSTTIQEPGAAWIKIHFSEFRLNKKDFVNLVDEHDRIIEHIKFRDVMSKKHSKFKSQKGNDQTVNFWTLAVDGQKVRVELHRTSNKSSNWGFKIDEIGIGSKTLFYKGLGPLYNNDEELGTDFISLLEKKYPVFDLNQMITPEESKGRIGRMLYKKGTIWYTCKGTLLGGSPNQFLPQENCIDSQAVVDTLEVRFYIYCHYNENNYPVYQSFYGDKFIDNYFDFEFGLLTLKRNTKMVEFYMVDGKPKYKSELSTILAPPVCWCPFCWALLDCDEVDCHCCN